MLFLDNNEISAQDLCEKFGADYKKIKSAPVFKAGKNTKFLDRVTGKEKTNEGTHTRSRFTYRASGGRVHTIQYAESAAPKEVGSKSIIDYKPRYVGFKGSTFNLKHNEDLAVYLYLNPINSTSPLRGPNYKEEYLKFHDAKKEAQVELAGIDNLEKALIHSGKVAIDTARVLLKAITKRANIDSLSDEEVRVDLRKIAHKDAEKYISAVNNKAMMFEGRVRDLMDKKVIVVKKSNGTRQWIWAAGDKDGSFIGEQIQNPREDERAYLIKHVLNNPEKYAEDFLKEYTTASSYEKANEYFDSIEAQSSLGKDVSDNVIVTDAINVPADVPETDNESLKNWMSAKGYKKVTSHIKQLKDGILDGTITSNNIITFAEHNFEKVVD